MSKGLFSASLLSDILFQQGSGGVVGTSGAGEMQSGKSACFRAMRRV